MAAQERMKSEERKLLILEATMEEYGSGGFHGTSTERIAERAGVSQPYLFRLFGTKNGLITAAIEHHVGHLRQTFRDAVEQRDADTSPMAAMGLAYLGFLEDDANDLRCQLHTWADGTDPAIREIAQRTYRDIWDDVTELSGADHETVRRFMSYGMLLTVLGSIGLLDLYGDPTTTLEEF